MYRLSVLHVRVTIRVAGASHVYSYIWSHVIVNCVTASHVIVSWVIVSREQVSIIVCHMV